MLLKNSIKGIAKLINKNNVLTTKEERYCYAVDAFNSPFTGIKPDCILFPETIDDVQKIVKYANQHNIPIVTRGAGTNMVGACVCTKGGIVLNMSKMNRILNIDPINMTASVEAGVILGNLKASAEEFGLFFPPDPSNYKVSTVGGAIAQSSGGAMSFKYGTTKDYVLSLKVVTADGELHTFGAQTTKDASGYHIAQMFVGSEGTLGIVVEAVLKLIPKPQTSNVVVAYFNSAEDALNAVNEIHTSNIFPAAIEYLDNNAVKTIEEYTHCHFKTCYDSLLLIELDGDEKSVSSQIDKVINILKTSNTTKIYIPSTKSDYDRIWTARRSSYAAATKIAPDIISDDIIVPRKYIPEIISKCRELADKYNLSMCLIGHIGDGNLHPQVALNTQNSIEYSNYINAKSELYEKVISCGGTLSAEHGIGLAKKEYLSKFIDKSAIEYMRMIKKVFDPKGILNPDKIF